MTLDEAIHAFATAETLPTEAVSWTIEHWDQAFPRLQAGLDAYLADIDRTEAAESVLFFLLHVAAESRETRIHAGLCRLLLDAELGERVLGDAAINHLSGLLISTYDGDPLAMQAVVESAGADEYVRGSVLLAVAYLTHAGRLPTEWMQTYLTRLYHDVLPREYSPIWFDWVTAVAALGYEALVPQAETAFKGGWVEPELMDLPRFHENLRDTLADPAAGEVLTRAHAVPFIDTIGTLGRWHFGDAAPDTEARGEPGWLTEPENHTPYVNPLRDVGRNDPCPCGSGKKYKKCCLAAA